MLVIWLVCAFGLISQTNTITANSTQAAITATSPAIEIDSSDAISDLDKAETKDATKKLEIIKQIRRVNLDGSYTVGYEAVDGTFKIESRDVLGNVKGTYGYVDENGEIKRVSYTANNTTNGLRSTPPPPAAERIAVHGRQNRTAYASTTTTTTTTRKPPSIAYLMSSTPSPLRANTNVVQAIPKRRILLASSSQTSNKNSFSSPLTTTTTTTTAGRKMELSTETSSAQKVDPTTTIVYATSIRSTVKPSTTTSIAEPSSTPTSSASASARSNSKIEISDRFSKVLNMNNKSLKILDESSEQSGGDTKSERKQLRGNALRRQLSNDQSGNFETHSQVVYSQSSDEDSVHTYSGVTGTQRPVFSTTSSPRIPALVLAARNRAAMLKNAALQTSVTTEKVYAKPPRRKSDRREESTSTTEQQSAENEYLTQSPVAVQIPANRDATQNDNIAHVYRHQNGYLPRPREYLRQSQSSNALENNNNNINSNINNNNNGPRLYKQVQSTYVQNDVENEQYLRETSESSVKGSTASTPEHYTNSDLNAATQPIYHPRNQRLYGAAALAAAAATQPGLRPTNVNEYEHRLQQQQSIPLPVQPGYQPYYGGGPVAPPYHNYPDRPLTARDFERLLNLLVVRHEQYRRFNYLPGLMSQNFFGGIGGLGYGGGGIGGGYFGGAGGYNPYGYPQIPPRAPLYNQFDPRYTAFSRSLPPVPPPPNLYAPYSEQENMYQAQSPVEQQLPYMGRMPQARRNYNQQYYATGESNDLAAHPQQKVIGGGGGFGIGAETGEYLPSDVREELLYRMLMLAIQPDVGSTIPVPDASTIQEYFKTTIPATVAAAAAVTTTPDPNPKKPVRSVQILGEER